MRDSTLYAVFALLFAVYLTWRIAKSVRNTLHGARHASVVTDEELEK